MIGEETLPSTKAGGKKRNTKGKKTQVKLQIQRQEMNIVSTDAFSFSLRGRRQDCLRVRGLAGQLEV